MGEHGIRVGITDRGVWFLAFGESNQCLDCLQSVNSFLTPKFYPLPALSALAWTTNFELLVNGIEITDPPWRKQANFHRTTSLAHRAY